jgi:hypothetical protein
LARFLLEHSWSVAVTLTVAAFALGVWGYMIRPLYGHEESSPRILHALYVAVLNFFLHGPYHGDLAWPLDLARFLAPVASGWLGIAGYLSLTEERRRVARILQVGRHTVVCGLGEKGSRLARESLGLGEPVVVIERDEKNTTIAEMKALGAVVLLGDATQPALLRQAGVERANRALVTLREDRDNLAVALGVQELVNAFRPKPEKADPRFLCHAHCGDLELAHLTRRNRLLGDPADAFELHLFSRHEIAARIVATEHLPAALARAAAERRTAHLALVGFDSTAQSVLLRSLETPHWDGPSPLRVTLIAPHASRVARDFHARYRLGGSENGAYDLCSFDPVDADVRVAQDVVSALQDAHRRSPLELVVVCLEDDAFAAKTALALRSAALSGASVLVRVRDARGLGAILTTPGGPVLFGSDDETCSRAMVVDEALDALATRIHEDHRLQKLGMDEGTSDAALRPWQALDADLARSNLSQADHIPMKLAVVRRRVEPGTSDGADSAFSKDEVEVLAQLEHARWNAERILSGWRRGPKDVPGRMNPYLVLWKDLDERIKEFDRVPVRELPKNLGRIGLRIVADGAASSGSTTA